MSRKTGNAVSGPHGSKQGSKSRERQTTEGQKGGPVRRGETVSVRMKRRDVKEPSGRGCGKVGWVCVGGKRGVVKPPGSKARGPLGGFASGKRIRCPARPFTEKRPRGAGCTKEKKPEPIGAWGDAS